MIYYQQSTARSLFFWHPKTFPYQCHVPVNLGDMVGIIFITKGKTVHVGKYCLFLFAAKTAAKDVFTGDKGEEGND